MSLFQTTTLQGDAADESLISGVCDRALKEEGRLDVFFANVHISCNILQHFDDFADHPPRRALRLRIRWKQPQRNHS